MGNLGRREVGLPLFDQGDYDHHENPLRNAPSSDYYLTTVIENPTKVSFFRIDFKTVKMRPLALFFNNVSARRLPSIMPCRSKK